jgi:hypothetical protein
MNFIIYSTFQNSLDRLQADDQKQSKITAMDLQLNPTSPGHNFHKLDRARDPRFWSVRVNRDLRIIVYRDPSRLILCYVDHHDNAYRWAQKRKLETNPKTGSAQIVEIREEVEIVKKYEVETETFPEEPRPAIIEVTDEELLAYGVPKEWLSDVKNATEELILDVADHLPTEAQEAVLQLAIGNKPEIPKALEPVTDPFEHPDALRRFRVMNNVEELQQALDFPWEKWTLFLHPDQKHIVQRDFNGPSRISGSAGTGKTIVALHRAVFLAKKYDDSRVLLTTFSQALANSLKTKLRRLIHSEPRLGERIDVISMNVLAANLFESRIGKVTLITRDQLKKHISIASKKVEGHQFSNLFILNEWEQVVDAWQINSWEDYRDFKRLGRKIRLAEPQRKKIWSIFKHLIVQLEDERLKTEAGMFQLLTDNFNSKEQSPYDHYIIDEAQDINVPQLKFMESIAGSAHNGLFFTGDLGQRIFQSPFSWKSIGINIQGRSSTLRVNYRTSHQIRSQSDMLLEKEIRDVDGNTEIRNQTVSIFNGPKPLIESYDSPDEEVAGVAKWLMEKVKTGSSESEIGVFVRSPDEFKRAEEALNKTGLKYKVLDENFDIISGHISVSTMHLAKGLEFSSVVVMACDDEVIPSQERLESVADESELEDVYNTERHLLYVACTRARDNLLITYTQPCSEFIDDIRL